MQNPEMRIPRPPRYRVAHNLTDARDLGPRPQRAFSRYSFRAALCPRRAAYGLAFNPARNPRLYPSMNVLSPSRSRGQSGTNGGRQANWP